MRTYTHITLIHTHRAHTHIQTFSEDPLVVGVLGAAVIRGLQNVTYATQDDGLLSTAACAKHFIAYSATMTGQDQAPVLLDARGACMYVCMYVCVEWEKAD